MIKATLNVKTKFATPIDLNALEEVINTYAILIENRAKENVMEYPLFDTGNLVGSISTDYENKFVRRVGFGRNAYYGEYFELGQGRRAKPFLLPALESLSKEFKEAIQKVLQK